MNDLRLESRKDNFKKCSFNILQHREKFNLSLRKKKLDEMIMEKRMKTKTSENQSENFESLEIDPYRLNIDRKFLPEGIKSLEEDGEVVVNMLKSNDLGYVKYAVYCLRVYFTNTDEDGKVIELKEMKGIEKCIFDSLAEKLLTAEDNSLIFEIYWTLVNMTVSEMEDASHLDIFATDQMIESMYKHLLSDYLDIVDNLIWLLNHLCAESTKFRDILIESKIFSQVVKILRKESNILDLLRLLTWLLANTMKKTETVPSENKILEILKLLSSYLYINDLEVMTHCLWGIYNISNFEESIPSINREILNSGCVVKMMSLNFNKCYMCLLPTLRILGNLCAGRNDVVDELLSLNVIDFFDAILITHEKAIRREVCWAISNIAAGNYTQIDKVLSSPVFDKVVQYLKDNDYRVRKESLWTIVNCTSCGVFDISNKLVSKGVIPILCDILRDNSTEKLLCAALEALKNILSSAECLKEHSGSNIFVSEFDKYGGSSLLERLETHTDQKVFNFSADILENFYKTETIN